MARRYEFLFEIQTLVGAGTSRLWTGETELSILSHTWTPTNIVEAVSIAGGDFAATETRLTLSLFATTDALRSLFLTDPGPARVTVRQVTSTDDGATWSVVPRAFAGRVSDTRLVGDRYRIDLVDRYGDPLRPSPRYWSDADQQRRAPGDRGLRYMALIESGVAVIWP